MPGTRQAETAPCFVMQHSLVDKSSGRASPVLLIRPGTHFPPTLLSMPRLPAGDPGLIVETARESVIERNSLRRPPQGYHFQSKSMSLGSLGICPSKVRQHPGNPKKTRYTGRCPRPVKSKLNFHARLFASFTEPHTSNMSEIKHMAKFSPSSELCPECIQLLSSELKEPVRLHQSFFSLHRSSQSCSLCRFMLKGLTGVLTVANGPRSQCNLFAIVKPKPGQSTEVWGRRHMVDFKSLGMDLSENFPISFIEVMMVKTSLVEHLAGQLGPCSTPESTRLNNSCWGLIFEPDVVREASICPYFWEYEKWVREAWRRNNVTANGKSTDFLWNMFSGNRPGDVWWGKG